MTLKGETNPINTSSSSSSYSMEHKIEATLICQAYKFGNFNLGATFFCATILLIGLFDTPYRLMLIGWYVAVLAVLGCRFISIEMYRKKNPLERNLTFWKNLFTFGAFLAGLSWGFLDSFLLPYHSLGQLSLMLFIIAGITAGAVPRLCAIKMAAYAFLAAALLPLVVTFLFIGDYYFSLFAVAIIVYLAYLLILAFNTHSMIKNTIILQYENDTLLNHLSIAKKELEEINVKLEHAARHDPLTNLANRSLFEINFANAIWRAQQENKILSLLYLDIDNFKEVNDAYGHHVGDLLLQKVVERIKRKLPESVIASRLGGDELTIILENINDLEEVADLCRKICNTIANPFEINDFTLSITTSIGVSFYPIDGTTIEALVKTADKAMYRSKNAGGNNFNFNADFTTLKCALSNAFKKDRKVKSIKNS